MAVVDAGGEGEVEVGDDQQLQTPQVQRPQTSLRRPAPHPLHRSWREC